MSNQVTRELKPPSAEEINNLRDELYSLKLKGTLDYLDDESIEGILLLSPSFFHEAIHNLVLAVGPLASFPSPASSLCAPTCPVCPDGFIADCRMTSTSATSHDELQTKRPSPIVDDGASYLDDALAALTSYNKLLEEKVTKFSIQSNRSLVTLRESAASDNDITILEEGVKDAKKRKILLTQQIATLRDSLTSHDKNHCRRLEEYDASFWNDVLFLNCYDMFSDKSRRSRLETASLHELWDEYDYMLQHVERWRSLVNVDSDGGEAVIDRARHHVNQLVYSITRQCQVQLATVFQESLTGHPTKSDHGKATTEEAADIIKEIDWLWEEVIPVAHMSVSAQYLRPVLTQFKNWGDSKKLREALVTTYASGALKFMNDRLRVVAKRTQMLVYHHQALSDVSRVRGSNETEHAKAASGHMPDVPARHTQPKREHTAASESVRTFMQIYGAAPVHGDGPYPEPTPSLLDEYVQNRAHKSDTVLGDLHKAFEAAATSGLADHELGGELLLDSLLADSAAGPARPGSVYKDAQLEGSIAVLRGQASQIHEMFQALKLGGPASASDYVAHAYKQTVKRQTAKAGEGFPVDGENPDQDRIANIRCPKFEDFVQKWSH